MLLIMGRKVRILRWDRSGVATTEAVDYVSEWQWFCDILWRISVLAREAPEHLGRDPSAGPLYVSIRTIPGGSGWTQRRHLYTLTWTRGNVTWPPEKPPD